jgi:putative permease
MQPITDWFKAYLSNPQVVILVMALIGVFLIVTTFGHMLAPVFASVIIAYLLEGVVSTLEKRHVPRPIAVGVVYIFFLAFGIFLTVGLLPVLSNQATQLFGQVPGMIKQAQAAALRLPELYPQYFTELQVTQLTDTVRDQVTSMGGLAVSKGLSSVVGVITIVVYVILVPLLVFFFMKDKRRLLNWALGFLPEDRSLASTVWTHVDGQIGNYVRGKFWEILVVWWATFVVFLALGLNFAMLLAVLVGLSVLIPYIGAAVVTIPVALVAFFQWGLGGDFYVLMVAYFIVQMLDGNVLVPLLFSEVVNLHPIAIIVAVLVFGGLWGFWGVFFAIPLATVVQAVLLAWPSRSAVVFPAGPRTTEEDL